ncbi:unnamed protein product [Peronospora belbahrii]|uniref:Uncharacterized protein n=1 Tax=Peronospora belbahrii TaxID=622444 RepID=A0AAU9KUU4_9STRA|nr:unnamed protein product [Peronospora belbahrii]CAH0516581.1 unnamed protein product [Peronospora belbahrii]
MEKTDNVNSTTKQEFAKLEVLLIETASHVTICLKKLKDNLGKYDRRHGLYFHGTSKHFMRNDIQVAKELATDLRYAAKRICRNKQPTRSEINAARMSMNATADAMNDLIQSGRIYDQNSNNGVSGGVTSIINNILGTNVNNQKENEEAFPQNGDDKFTTKRRFFGHKHTGGGIPKSSDTVGAVVLATLHETFGGFSALKQQIADTENAMSPSFAARAKEAVKDIANNFVDDFNPSPNAMPQSL